MNKKALIIGSSLNYGSPGRICENIGLKAMSEGWTVYQAHGLKYSRPSRLNNYPVCSRWGETKHALDSFLFDAHGLSSKGETKRLVGWIKEISPDIIHLHNLHGYFLNYEVLFKYLSTYDKPVVWTLHDFWPITGHCAHFDYIGCQKWKTQCEHCPQFHSYPKSLFLDRSRRNYDAKQKAFTSVPDMTIVPVSKWVGSLIEQSFLSKYPIKPIYSGIDVDVFRHAESDLRKKLNLDGKFVMIGVASPWYPMKGMKDYFALNETLPPDCKIIMVGLNKKQIKNLPRGIIGVEKTNSLQELARYYSMADVSLNLSYQESFGMTTVEAMSCGTPGIVYNSTASPELVSSETGLIVEPGDIEHLYDAVMTVKNKTKENYSAACRTRVVENFDNDKQLQKYIDLYNSLLYGNTNQNR